MKRLLATVLAAVCAGCGGGTATGPSPVRFPTSSTASPGDTSTVTFSGLTGNSAPISTYAESGFTISTVSGEWSARTDYGNPKPFVQFWAPGGSTVIGAIRITKGTAPFYFKSVDLYASTTPIPYLFTGLHGGNQVFAVSDTLPNTFGDFRTVTNPHSADPIDTLVITLTNAAAPCCRNPMGLDTIVLPSTPSTTPTSFVLSGTVSDAATSKGIAGARLDIADGPNQGQSVTADPVGNYIFPSLPPSSFTLTASASGYTSQSKTVTLASNQTVSFQLASSAPRPSPAAITFDGLTVNGQSVRTYLEDGFTVVVNAGSWTAVTTYGNPAPSLQFFAQSGQTVTGEVSVSVSPPATFSFASVDLYASLTPIPYTITGRRSSAEVFTLADTLPNTFGNFRTVSNPTATALIDQLIIRLTNTVPIGPGSNPMGLDNIAVNR